MHTLRKLGLVVTLISTVSAIATSTATGASGHPTVAPQPFAAPQSQPLSTTDGGAAVQPTTRTIPHWWGSTLNPQDGTTYGYNMVGADPAHCSGAGCAATVEVDITPVIVKVDGMTFSGSDVVAPVLASPAFALNDYGATPYATDGADFPFGGVRGPGGVLSQGDAGNQLQLLDATMRAQFNRTGASNYHLRLRPNVLPPVTIDVPQNQGLLLQSPRGVVFAGIEPIWWENHIHNLARQADPTHLALYLSDDVTEFCFHQGFGRCIYLGVHGASKSASSNGDAPVQTFAWATWLSPGMLADTAPELFWSVQDIQTLSHELSEWADDPFVTNTVEPAPFYPGFQASPCNPLLEVGDPVSFSAFAIGANGFRQGPDPDGTQSADGYYHPEDEVNLPWFMRQAPNTVSEPTQSPSQNVGRYTFMGDLNGSPGLTAPPAPCS
jgi:hypothetical protein